jgi:hypothetical protein
MPFFYGHLPTSLHECNHPGMDRPREHRPMLYRIGIPVVDVASGSYAFLHTELTVASTVFNTAFQKQIISVDYQ